MNGAAPIGSAGTDSPAAAGVAAGQHLVLVGPTASGKSAVAMAIARRGVAAGHPIEIVSVDSMQVYRGMDIGTAKPTRAERDEVPHHLLDLVDPDSEHSVAEFAARTRAVIADIQGRGARALLVGGTGLYVQSVVDDLQVPGRFPEVARSLDTNPDTAALHCQLVELDPVAAGRMEPGNRRRILRALEVTIGSGRRFSEWGPGLGRYPDTPFVLCGLSLPRDVLTDRIERRYREQMAAGFLEEVQQLTGSGPGLSRTAAQALGYTELIEHLDGRCTLDEALERAALRTRQFAVRQIRWFRRDPRITWFDHDGEPMSTVDDIEDHWRKHLADRSGSTTTVGVGHAPPSGGRT